MDRGFPDTAQTEMSRLMDECAKLGRDNARLRVVLQRALRFVDAFEPRSRAAEIDQQETLREGLDILSNVSDHRQLPLAGQMQGEERAQASGMTTGSCSGGSPGSRFSPHDEILKEFGGTLTSGVAAQLRSSKEGRCLGR